MNGFDLEAFKQGVNALDREGNEWRYVGTLTGNDIDHPIAAQKIGDLFDLETFTNNGFSVIGNTSPSDLVSMVSRHAELKKTYVEGDVWQHRPHESEPWETLEQEPQWLDVFDYRIHPLNDFIKAHKADEKVMWQDAIIGKSFDWDHPKWEPANFSKKKKKDKSHKVGDLVMVWDCDIKDAKLKRIDRITSDNRCVTESGYHWEHYLTLKQWAKKVSKLNKGEVKK